MLIVNPFYMQVIYNDMFCAVASQLFHIRHKNIIDQMSMKYSLNVYFSF